ncbi:MAG: type VI secretion system tube protein TssD [Anaerohalosphaeraceae bacterium]
MNDQRTRIFMAALVLVCLAGLLTCYVTGGDLNPNNTPSPTMRTLDELYKNIQPGLPSDWLPYPKEQQVAGVGAIHMAVRGQVQGDIQGSCTAGPKERTNTSVVVGLGHEILVPTDAASGLPTGRRQHKPLIVTKYVDKATPLLYTALVNNENLTRVELRFYRTNDKGLDELYYMIRLTNARISDNKTAGPNIEQISFAYQRIEWIWINGEITAMDDWEASPV